MGHGIAAHGMHAHGPVGWWVQASWFVHSQSFVQASEGVWQKYPTPQLWPHQQGTSVEPA